MTKITILVLSLIIAITNGKTAINLWKDQNKVASVATLLLSVSIMVLTIYLYNRLKA